MKTFSRAEDLNCEGLEMVMLVFEKQQGDQWLQCSECSFIHCAFIPWNIVPRAVRRKLRSAKNRMKVNCN